MMTMLRWAAAAAVGLLVAGTAQAATPAQKCETDKNKEAGKYAFCRQKAEAKYATTGDGTARTAALQKCLNKYNAKWPSIESKAGGACPSTGDQSAIQGVADTYTTNVATALAGGVLVDCPADLLSCQGDLTTCGGDLATCGADLATCQAVPKGQRLKTGQAICYNTAGSVIFCAGTGQDGELQKGLARAYVDNGNGTITDTRTGLMWEKQSDDGTLNDKDNVYTWANAFAVKIAGLNAGGGFAGYTDWRLPNRAELESLVHLGAVSPSPSVSPAFNTSCTGGCTLATCSCTRLGNYWSSSTYANSSTLAWFVSFGDGGVLADAKTAAYAVRGVRGGS